jgi:hypothetical protein
MATLLVFHEVDDVDLDGVRPETILTLVEA